ncbi:cell wall hydrolase [Nitrobacteraceae bacterium UC4449_H16]
MANNDGRREVVTDPLAANAREQRPDRSLQMSGVRAPQTPSAASLTHDDGLEKALSGVEGLLAQEFEKKKDGWITEGKVAFQSGVTEQTMLENGNAFTAQGYYTLQARDKVNNWFMDQTVAMDETGKQTDPKAYAAHLKQQRATILDGITDPHARKVASAAFEDMSPRLAQTQAIKNNEYNRTERVKAFSSTLYSTGPTSATASVREPGKPLAMSPVPVEPVMQPSARDRDVGIRTMLGEAGNQGDDGMAAVAHVLRNRTVDGRWPTSIAGVSLQPKQFSAWNAGPGGNTIPYNAKPGSPMYEKAGAVFDAVMSGRHVDPTGGATHYYSPAGMQKLVADGDQANAVPKWLDEETARAGGRIKIGGHIFVGKAGDAAVRPSKSYDTQLSAEDEKKFQAWKETNAPNDSGADYDLRGAFKAGVTPAANGHWPDTYKKPNHPTFSDQSQYATGADKAKAGRWEGDKFISPQVTATTIGAGTPGDINAVPAQEGVGVTGVVQAKGTNEVQQLIRGYTGLNDKDKATAVADAMRRGLDAGDESLFRDAGGVAALHQLGAQPGEVDEVLKARKRFDDKKLTEFNVDREKYRNDIFARAEKGEDVNTLLADIDAKHKAGFIDDASARALAHGAADKVRQQSGDKSKLSNTDMLNELGGLYQKIATGGDFKTLADEGAAIAKKYGATEKDIQHIVGKIFSDSQSYQNKLREETKTIAKTKLEQDGIKAGVARSISQGYGLSNVTGSVKITNDAGQPETVTAQEYGIRQIKDRWGKEYADAVSSGKMTAAQAKPELERKVMLELQNHGVVDKQTQAQLVGALSGNIVDKSGAVKPAAVQAYDTWLTMKNTPGITPAYMTKVVADDTTRNLLEHAFLLDSGTLSKEQSLLKAHEILNDPSRDPQDKINRDVIWKQKMDVDLKKALIEHTAPGFFDRLFDTKDRNERERLLTNNRTAENYVNARADAYHFQNPNEYAEVSMKKAIDDLQAHSVPVMGNLIITKPGKELDKVMGVSGFGPTAAEDAVSGYLLKNGAKIWGKSYTDREAGYVTSALNKISELDNQLSPQGIAAAISPGTFDDASRYKNSRPKHPPMHITYNAELGVMTVDLYKDNEMKQTLGQPKHFNVRSIGAEYVKEQTTPGSWAKAWNAMFKGTAKAIKDGTTALDEWSYTTPYSKPRPQ